GLLELGVIMDVYADLPPLLPPSLEPSVTPVPSSCFARLPCPPWSVVDHPSPRTPLLQLCLVPPAPSGFSIPSATPWSSVALAPPLPSRSSSSPWLIGSVYALGSSTAI
ncbi:hypothetical protein M9458_048672, partial [Cirrhinus mrigala]